MPGRLGIATVLANAVFAFVTGVSIAAAAAFSRIAWPEMKRHGYERKFALGCIAGSACLGMLIPPSVLMIVWGVLTEQAIGKLFIAGIIPGFVVVAAYSAYILFVAVTQPERVGEARKVAHSAGAAAPLPPARGRRSRWTTPSSARCWSARCSSSSSSSACSAASGSASSRRPRAPASAPRWRCCSPSSRACAASEIFDVILTVGRTSAPLLLLLVMAQLYSRVLSMTGVTGAAKALFLDSGLEPWQILTIMVLIWFVLGCIIDSISIILLTVPVFAPIAVALGYDPIAFAILGIIAIETGLLTPPFGILVFTVKAALPQEKVSTGEIFAGSVPYWICLLVVIVILAAFPQLATWLPNLGRQFSPPSHHSAPRARHIRIAVSGLLRQRVSR